MNSKENIKKLDACKKYFAGNRGYQRAFELMRKKWRQYGRIAGRVILKDPSSEEREALEGFFAKEFSEDVIRFSVPEFEEALQQTRFCGVGLEELLHAYFGEELITNKEAQRQKQQNKKMFFQELLAFAQTAFGPESRSAIWLKSVIFEKKYGYSLINKEYQKDPAAVCVWVHQVCQAMEYLEKHSKIRLAVLGAEITRNPHEYDRGTIPGRLLIQGLSCIHQGMACKSAEEILMLYYASGIKPDDISSFSAVYGIHFYTEDGEHPAYKGFIERGEPYIITLSNLGRIVRAEVRKKKVYMIENQMVFSHLCEALQGRECALVCTSGQIKTASLMLLDMLCEAGCRIFYSGDFDPEGISIAEKVLVRSRGCARLWHMSKEDYELCLSEEEIREESMHKLDKVTLTCLQEVKMLMQNKKKAGYQEQLIEYMLKDILEG